MEYQSSILTIMVADMDRAVRFYTEALGLPLGFRAGNEWAEVRGQGMTIGLHPARAGMPRSETSGGVSIGFQVSDIAAAMSALREQGVQFAGPAAESGVGQIVHFADPDGTALYLLQEAERSGSP